MSLLQSCHSKIRHAITTPHAVSIKPTLARLGPLNLVGFSNIPNEDQSQTRCVPSYNTKCKIVKDNVMKKLCKMEYKAECFQVLIKVKEQNMKLQQLGKFPFGY